MCISHNKIDNPAGTEEERKCQKEPREESKEDDEITNSDDKAENDVTENEPVDSSSGDNLEEVFEKTDDDGITSSRESRKDSFFMYLLLV